MATIDEHQIDIQTVIQEMRQLQQKSRMFMENLTSNDQLSQNQLMLLMDLKLTGSMRITDISERFFITAGAATSMCDKLEELNYINRIRTMEDRRVVMVALTDSGEQKLASVFKRLPADQLQTIAAVFKEINELMSQVID